MDFGANSPGQQSRLCNLDNGYSKREQPVSELRSTCNVDEKVKPGIVSGCLSSNKIITLLFRLDQHAAKLPRNKKKKIKTSQGLHQLS